MQQHINKLAWKKRATGSLKKIIKEIILTLAESCMVKSATFSWEDSSSRLNLRICCGQIEKQAPADYTQCHKQIQILKIGFDYDNVALNELKCVLL